MPTNAGARPPQLGETTHVFFCARAVEGNYVIQVDTNRLIVENLLDALIPAAPRLRHIQIIHGMKWYGSNLGPYRTPAKESHPRLRGPQLLLRAAGRAHRAPEGGRLDVVDAAPALRVRRLRRQPEQPALDPGHLRGDPEGTGRAAAFPRRARCVRRRAERDGRAPPRQRDGVGRDGAALRRTRRSTSSTATPSAGAMSGRCSPRTSACRRDRCGP